MPLALDPDSEPKPDIAVVLGSPRDYRDAHPTSAELIVEVADSTLAYDRERKAKLYAQAGIQECWILNLLDRQLEIYRQPKSVPASTPSYNNHEVKTSSETIIPCRGPQKSIVIADLLP